MAYENARMRYIHVLQANFPCSQELAEVCEKLASLYLQKHDHLAKLDPVNRHLFFPPVDFCQEAISRAEECIQFNSLHHAVSRVGINDCFVYSSYYSTYVQGYYYCAEGYRRANNVGEAQKHYRQCYQQMGNDSSFRERRTECFLYLIALGILHSKCHSLHIQQQR